MSRLTIDITTEQHQTLKAMAALEGKSIKLFALARLFPTDEQMALNELRALLQSRLTRAGKQGATELSAEEIAGQTLRAMDVA